jgi:hypothetical protein
MLNCTPHGATTALNLVPKMSVSQLALVLERS